MEQFSSEARWHAVERVFVPVQVMTACFVAFAHGSNDVANAVGPLSAAVQALTSHSVRMTAGVPAWVLALGGVGIVIGLATWGWRVMKTVGEKITELTPSRGFCAEFAAAIVILVASVMPLGLPVSTTHTLVGAVLEGKVDSVANFGVFVVLGPGRKGLVPNVEMGTPRGTDHRKQFPPGTPLRVKVLEVTENGRRIRLSRKAVIEEQERGEVDEYLQSAGRREEAGFGTLGDILKKKLPKT